MDVLEAPNGMLIKGLGCSRRAQEPSAAPECSIRRRQSPEQRDGPPATHPLQTAGSSAPLQRP